MKRLPGIFVVLIAVWITMAVRVRTEGATGPAVAPGDPKSSPYDFSREKNWWSFQPVRDVSVPHVKDDRGLISPIDVFLQSGQESRRLRSVGPADKRVLIRRATYDLTGLPPTPEEIETFVTDQSPNAFEKVVDRLLASPHYGEQWGRHWLDVVRYADTAGNNPDFPVPQAYKYRNYVIDSFNRDKPFNQFLREQIAGDLLPAKDENRKHEQIIATGYTALSRRFGSGGSDFPLTIADTIDNLGKSMLGLSIGCARCHDHKFDPIPASDYYALYGIFDSTTYAFPGTETLHHPKDFVALGTPEEAKALHDYDQRLFDLDKEIRKLQQERLALSSRAKASKSLSPQDAADLDAKLKQNAADVKRDKEEQQRLDKQGPPNVDRAYGVSEGTPHDVKIQRKGLLSDLGPVAPRGFLTILGGQKLPASEKGSGRLELANWIASNKNPLTARVMTNRIWEYHFGKGIVATPNDFGHRGMPPFDPTLLDYLTTRFIKSGWSVKAMHKLIMLSQAYQLSDADDATDSAIDSSNTYLWRFDPRRLSAEEIRDSILADSASLDPTVDPGPHPFPPQQEWKYTQHRPFVADYPTNHRSVYLMQQRIRKQPFLQVFDGADTNDTSPDRPLSTTAIQALFMMNDPFLYDQADKLATRVFAARPDAAGRIDYAYQLLFARRATADEVAMGKQYMAALQAKLNTPGDRDHAAMDSYLRVLLSSNEFVWLD